MNNDILTRQDFKAVAAVVLLETAAPVIADTAHVNAGKIFRQTRFTSLWATYFSHFVIFFAYFLDGFIREAARIVRHSFAASL